MTIFGKIKEYFIRNLSLTDPKAWDRSLWNLYGSQSLSGETVTEQTALTYSAFWCGVSLISGTVSTLPLHLMQRKGDKKRIADERKLYQVMHDQWNEYMTAEIGRQVMMNHILTWGNGYAEKVRNGYGEVIELWPITPNRVTPRMQDGALVYEIRMDREAPITLPRDKVLHIPGLGFDGFTGYSVVAMARKSLGLSMALETFGSNFFGKGTNPSMVVSHPGQLKDPANLRKAMQEAYSGLGQSHRLMLLEEGMKVEKYGIPPDDCQFLESRAFQIPEVARWLNLPPHKLKDLSKSSFNNIEEENGSFYIDSILPWLIRLETNYNSQLLTPGDRGLYGQGRLYFKHNAEGILRANSESRGNFYRSLFGIGGITINQILEKEDMNPIDHPFANEPFVPLNMVPLSLLEKALEKGLVKQGATEEDPGKPSKSPKKQVPMETPEKKKQKKEDEEN